MTAAEMRAAQQNIGLSDEAVAAELGLTPAVVAAWRAGSTAIPERHAAQLRWRAAIAERHAATEASGLPACAWVQAWENRPVPDEPEAMRRHFEGLTAHGESCPTCTARAEYVEKRFGPLPPPPSPGGLVRAIGLLERVPAWARPAAIGAAILGAIVGLRIVFVLPAMASQPRRFAEALVALIAAMGAGAAGGLAYSLTRSTLRRLGRPGDQTELVVFAIVSTFFGLVVGHSWFRRGALG